MWKVLMVCSGNICRSPMAEAVGRQLAARSIGQRIMFESAGTHAVVKTRRPDPRAVDALVRHGYATETRRTRSVKDHDFDFHDLVLAMDRRNLDALGSRCPAEFADRLHLLLDFAPGCLAGKDIPDPYYGDAAGFENVLRLCEVGAGGLIAALRARHPPDAVAR